MTNRTAQGSLDGGTLYHALPTGVPAPDGRLAVVSTDSGRTWTVRESRP
jgi:hypothetical protein